VETLTLTFDSWNRSAQVALPVDSPRSTPIAIVLHGGGGTGARIAEITGLDRALTERGFVALFPDGIAERWNDGRDSDDSPEVDDVAFILALADEAAQRYGANPSRVCIAGASNGAMLAHHIACTAANRLAAIATAMGTLPATHDRFGTPSAPLPVLMIHGTDDPIVPYDGGEVRLQRQTFGEVLSVADTAAFWAVHNGCAPRESIGAGVPPDDQGLRVRCDHHPAQAASADVTVYTIEGGGHTWPGSEPYGPEWLIGKTHHGFGATEVISDFFARHSRLKA
jgi:polyhydroxybutyrate depolymerase